MDTAGIVFGLMGFTFAIVALNHAGSVKKELDGLKKSLRESGILKEQTESEG